MQPHYSDNAFHEHELPELRKGLKMAFIGNSLTLHAPSEEIGWHNECGMAASHKNVDYVHLLLRSFGLSETDAYIRNFYPFETDLTVAHSHLLSLDEMLSQRPQVVVIQLGDNVGNQEQLNNFAQNLLQLVDRVRKHSPFIFCASTWWHSPPKDHVIAKVCEIYGANYVFIGDLFNHPDNTDRQVRNYAHQGVEAHPKDWAMTQISGRFREAILAVVPSL